MIGRRDILRAAAAGGLAFGSRDLFAQTTGTEKKKSTPAKKKATPEPPVVADERVNQVLAPVRDEHRLPGLIGAIVTGNKLAAIGALGIRKIGATDPIRVTDQVHLGSDTKAMTATMIGTLVDEGKLSWGSKIGDVFTQAASQIHRDYRSVTLSYLLTHRAGLPANAPWWDLPGKTTTAKRRTLLTTTLRDAPLTKPGSTYAYSNVGYVLAALMAEHVSGQSWETLMTKRLFEPLGMTSAGFGSPGHAGKVDQPWGHRDSGGEVRPTQVDNAPVLGPAGTVHCSVPDWAKFASLHMSGAQGKPKILKASTFRALHTPPPGNNYAGGWIVLERSWANGLALNHSGSNTAWYATIWIAPVRDFGILVATNLGGDTAFKANDQAVTELLKSFDFLTRARSGGR
jgi:CubicO group peptidase (beta-lactamase class C family)